jgi:hypothetical protein
MSPYELVILSHHKCATNWIRNIARVMEQEGLVRATTISGKDKSRTDLKDCSAPTILLNVNAFRNSMKDIKLDQQPTVHFIRDPRDALVSNYWSWRGSHQINSDKILKFREAAQALSVEDGMLLLLNEFPMGRQLETWPAEYWNLVKQIRYENLLENFTETFRSIFAPAGIHVDVETLTRIEKKTSFETMTGRRLGEESVEHHYRKGVAGDWEKYFTPALTSAFQDRYGWLGSRLGYW